MGNRPKPQAPRVKKFVGVYDQSLLNNPATRSGGQKSPKPKADPFLKQVKDVDNQGHSSRASQIKRSSEMTKVSNGPKGGFGTKSNQMSPAKSAGTQAGKAITKNTRGSMQSSVARVTGKSSAGKGISSATATSPRAIKGGQGRVTPQAIAPKAGKAGGSIVKAPTKAAESSAMKKDQAMDKKKGIKEGSPEDKRLDAAVRAKARKSK